MQYEQLSSEKELREYIFSLIEQAEATRKAADKKAQPFSYFRLTEIAGIVTITLHLNVANKKLRRDVPDAPLANQYYSVRVIPEALQAFRNQWKEAQIEEEVIPRPNMTTYFISSFKILAGKPLYDHSKRS